MKKPLEQKKSYFPESLGYCLVVPPAPLIHRDVYRELGGFDEEVRIGDFEYAIRISKNYNIGLVKEPLYIYYDQNEEDLPRIYKNRIYSYNYILKKYKKDYEKHPEKAKSIYSKLVLGQIQSSFFGGFKNILKIIRINPISRCWIIIPGYIFPTSLRYKYVKMILKLYRKLERYKE